MHTLTIRSICESFGNNGGGGCGRFFELAYMLE